MPYTSLSRTTSKTGQKFWKFFRMPVPRHAPTLFFPPFPAPGPVRRPDVPLTPNRPPHRRRNHPATARELGGGGAFQAARADGALQRGPSSPRRRTAREKLLPHASTRGPGRAAYASPPSPLGSPRPRSAPVALANTGEVLAQFAVATVRGPVVGERVHFAVAEGWVGSTR